jgi:hypothetical protein
MILSYDIPDTIATETIDALCWQFGYKETVPDPGNPGSTMPNPETRGQFAKRQGAIWFKSRLIAYRENVAKGNVDRNPPEIS